MRAGKVTAKGQYGIGLDNERGADGKVAWLNWSRDMEDRSVTDLVQKGDVVEVEIVDGKFITSLRIVEEPASAPSGPSPDGDDQWVLKDKRLGRQTAVKAAAVILAAYIGNHDTVQWPDILSHYDDLLEKAGVFID